MRPPAFWAAGLDPYSREAAPVTKALLTPLAWLTTRIHKQKIAQAKPAAIPAKVVSVGGVTLGGAGKTPVVQAVRTWLSAHTDGRIATLSRGYGGRLGRYPQQVKPNTHTAREVGDEPLMLSQSGESWIGKKKDTAAREMAKEGVECIILDDAHQTVSLQKDLSILVLDADAPLGNGFVFPKGPLREPITEAISRADLIVWLGEAALPDTLNSYGIPVLAARLVPTLLPIDEPVIAFAGLGRPTKFFDMLTRLGWHLADAVPFDDHYLYKPQDLKFLWQMAEDRGARLVTTEKDYVRLPKNYRRDVMTVPVSVEFEESSEWDAALSKVLADE